MRLRIMKLFSYLLQNSSQERKGQDYEKKNSELNADVKHKSKELEIVR